MEDAKLNRLEPHSFEILLLIDKNRPSSRKAKGFDLGWFKVVEVMAAIVWASMAAAWVGV